jgi:CxxC motif-containing protein (DUF1111 family)
MGYAWRFNFFLFVSVFVLISVATAPADMFVATDPGVRGGPAGAGGPLPGLSPEETAFFNEGFNRFTQVDGVPQGLGPRFNTDSCASCHAYPAVGGTSPFANPEFTVANKNGATNTIPYFVLSDGPVREARFIFNRDGTRDGGVHDLYTITARSDAPGCVIAQPDFLAEAKRHNIIFRIPTRLFGAGLVESIPDDTIIANMNANKDRKRALRISGHPNISGNDGTITRFGWKAQIKSLIIFSGEAYNVEVGVTNDLFPQERDETPACLFNPLPESRTNLLGQSATAVLSDVEMFSFFMRFLDQAAPVPDTPSIANGRQLFDQIGCTMCHTPSLTTGNTEVAALRNKQANVYSDLLLHNMGVLLADNIIQGSAGPDEFRTAPLWNVGQRIFFLHDGRTKNIRVAIQTHASIGSEANTVIFNFNRLRELQKQDILNFLRSL